MTISVHGGTSFSSSIDDFLIFRLEIRQIWEQSLNRPVWVLLELIQLLVFLELLALLELFQLLERLQLLHVLPAFFVAVGGFVLRDRRAARHIMTSL